MSTAQVQQLYVPESTMDNEIQTPHRWSQSKLYLWAEGNHKNISIMTAGLWDETTTKTPQIQSINAKY